MPVVPATSLEAFSEITKTVVDATIETNMWAPVPIIKNKGTVGPSPIRRCPEESNFWSQDPRAWNPVVVGVIVAPRPVAGSPDVAIAGTERLLIDGQRGWAKPDRDPDLPERCCRDHHNHCEQDCSNRKITHLPSPARSSFAYPVLLRCCGLRGSIGTSWRARNRRPL